MRKFFSLSLSLVAIQNAIIASHARRPSRRPPTAVSSVPSTQRGKPGPLAYAIGLADFMSTAQFGLLDIGAGTFLGIAELPHSAQGIARANGEIFAMDAINNLVRIDPGGGKVTIVAPPE
jgi:hypothetical protein